MRPTRLALYWLGALALVGLAQGLLTVFGVLGPAFASVSWALVLAILVLMLLDALLLTRRLAPEVSRQLPGNLAIGRSGEVWLHIRQRSQRPLTLEVFDHPPPGLAFEDLPQQVTLKPGEHVRLAYRLRPLRRGRFLFERCELALSSAIGLWTQRRYLPVSSEARVFPDFARLYGAELRVMDAWLGQMGVRQRQRRGEGQSFHQLREFRDGDSIRQIDWKATARKRAPIVREYQDERDQQIVLWLDTSRRMRSQDGELSHFDHALNAGLLLAYIALRQGDAVGVRTLVPSPCRVSPAKGQRQLGTLLGAVYDLDSHLGHADFSEAANTLLVWQKRRALVILLTNLRDEDDEELLLALKRIGRHHRVLVASLREEVLDQAQQSTVASTAQALEYCAVVDYLSERRALHERLAAHGIPVLDVRPGELGTALVGKYLEWKRAGVL
ncbi:DUF58 domain-containing protein [Pseudomonas sp. KNUC1026]|uniref:DUF58 domain-containing protein n=1 Tax=Pseudomonas sp. KNUC1026 TaxID=2893890 RepID=UPI001F2DE971|nr:DUF58 domain-containing protein [Pseudomonas sp. KNUC1026]UFH51737.1 DUF58 domain-containing protein [Pseudomonas sp. KNUC1026]